MNPGDIFAGHYRIDALLGQGGMGSVYRARDTRLDRDVALKIIHDTHPDAAARLIREARSAAALDHPNVVSVFDIGQHEGTPYIVMELVPGRTLRAVLGEPPAPEATRLGWLLGVARALGAAHERNLAHRDVKPENVMVRPDGSIKVLDFGIARRILRDPAAPAAPTLTRAGTLVGTPCYMAPEQIRNDAFDHRADQFAWGVLAYEMLAGKTPWRGSDPLAVIASVLTDEVDPAPLAAVSPPLRTAVLRALRKNPEERFASMAELIAAATEPGTEARAGTPARAPTVAGETGAPRYTTQEMRAILERAIDLQEQAPAGSRGRFRFDELVAAAQELGIDPATLSEASRGLQVADQGEEAARWLRRKRRSLLRHVGAYVSVNAAFVLFGMLVVNSLKPMLIPGIFWAIGLGIHVVHVLTADVDEWRDAHERKRRLRQKRERRSPAVEEAATLLLRTTEGLRQRVVSLDEQARQKAAAINERVRVAVSPAAVPISEQETDLLASEQIEDPRRMRR